jgi:hypothetical protein
VQGARAQHAGVSSRRAGAPRRCANHASSVEWLPGRCVSRRRGQLLNAPAHGTCTSSRRGPSPVQLRPEAASALEAPIAPARPRGRQRALIRCWKGSRGERAGPPPRFWRSPHGERQAHTHPALVRAADCAGRVSIPRHARSSSARRELVGHAVKERTEVEAVRGCERFGKL